MYKILNKVALIKGVRNFTLCSLMAGKTIVETAFPNMESERPPPTDLNSDEAAVFALRRFREQTRFIIQAHEETKHVRAVDKLLAAYIEAARQTPDIPWKDAADLAYQFFKFPPEELQDAFTKVANIPLAFDYVTKKFCYA